MKNQLIQELSYLDKPVNLNDFNTIERNLKYHLRFELADVYETDAAVQVDQAVTRATELLYHQILSGEVYVVVYDPYEAGEHSYIRDMLDKSNLQSSSYNERLALRYYENEPINWVDGQLSIYKGSRDQINFEDIFRGIANTELGFLPVIPQLVFVVQPKRRRWFWMYDDRGCLLFSQSSADLLPFFVKYEDWLVDIHRPQMLEQFM